MQDLHSSHSEVALSWTEMMTMTQAAGLSTVDMEETVLVCVSDASVCTVRKYGVTCLWEEICVSGGSLYVNACFYQLVELKDIYMMAGIGHFRDCDFKLQLRYTYNTRIAPSPPDTHKHSSTSLLFSFLLHVSYL